MFSRSNQLPQRKPCALKPHDVIEDVEAVCNSQEESRMLFTCLEDKIQHYGRDKMNTVIKEAQILEDVSNKLKEKITTLQSLADNLSTSIEDIKSNIGNINQANFE